VFKRKGKIDDVFGRDILVHILIAFISLNLIDDFSRFEFFNIESGGFVHSFSASIDENRFKAFENAVRINLTKNNVILLVFFDFGRDAFFDNIFVLFFASLLPKFVAIVVPRGENFSGLLARFEAFYCKTHLAVVCKQFIPYFYLIYHVLNDLTLITIYTTDVLVT
jgi:hypothetical protein